MEKNMKSVTIAIASLFAASIAFAQSPVKKEEPKKAEAKPAVVKQEAKPAAPAKKEEKKESAKK